MKFHSDGIISLGLSNSIPTVFT